MVPLSSPMPPSNEAETATLLISSPETVPEFANLFQRLSADTGSAVQDEVRLTRRGKLESLLVRMTERHSISGVEGFVVAFDDVTDLVSAQRMSLWN